MCPVTTEGCETRWKTEPEPEGLSTGGTEHRLRVHWAGSRAPPAESEMTSREGCQGGASVPGCGVCKSLCVCVMPLLCVLVLCLGAFGGRAGPGRAGEGVPSGRRNVSGGGGAPTCVCFRPAGSQQRTGGLQELGALEGARKSHFRPWACHTWVRSRVRGWH